MTLNVYVYMFQICIIKLYLNIYLVLHIPHLGENENKKILYDLGMA